MTFSIRSGSTPTASRSVSEIAAVHGLLVASSKAGQISLSTEPSLISTSAWPLMQLVQKAWRHVLKSYTFSIVSGIEKQIIHGNGSASALIRAVACSSSRSNCSSELSLTATRHAYSSFLSKKLGLYASMSFSSAKSSSLAKENHSKRHGLPAL